MRTLIFEPNYRGHRLHYVRLIADALLIQGHEVEIALSRDAVRSIEFDVHLSSLPARFHELNSDSESPGTTWGIAGRKLRAFSDLLRRSEVDHVYIPYGDGMTQRGAAEALLRIRRGVPSVFTEGLQLRGHFAYPGRDPRSRILSRLTNELMIRSPWDRVHVLDPLAYERLERQARESGRSSKFDLIPEPVELDLGRSRAEARERIGLDPRARYVGAVGAIDNKRKGSDLLLAAFASGLGAGVKLLLVGKQNSTIKAALGTEYSALVQAGSIVSLDSYVSQQDLSDAIASCDVVALPYRQHSGSSGIAVRAAAARRPIVASGYGWLGECVRRFQLGATYRGGHARDLAEALASVLQESSPLVLTERARRFVEFNTVENFQAVWTRQIRLRAKQTALPSAKTWEWVMSG